ncbi:olfactory receptor-like protein DTMT [Genypterus blacodes]|uniref:olfactory receptor-like protein DTMT n=1 Tax=Genypterus blacodes TaxID=154954 RepID=UPI003F774FF9
MKPMYFGIFLIVYIVIIAANVLLISLIYKEKSLHEPMYFLLCNLAVNGLYGSTTLLPALLSNVLSYSYEISLSLCQTQIYGIHTYAIVEFTILAAMSYDRYVAICRPLLYHAMMSQRVFKLIIFTWLYPMTAFLIVFILTVRLHFCEATIDSFYCLNYSLVRLSCSDVAVVNIVGLLSK